MLIFALLSVAVFVASALLDAIEAYYVRSVADGKPERAAVYSVAMYVIGCVGFFSVIEYSWWLMIPECAGLYFGSVIAIKRQRNHATCKPTSGGVELHANGITIR